MFEDLTDLRALMIHAILGPEEESESTLSLVQ